MVYFARLDIATFKPQDHCTKTISVIKIGWTRAADVRPCVYRLRTITKRPATLLATTPGDRATERAIHRRFDNIRVEGGKNGRPEWFYPTRELMEFIASIRERAEVA